MPASHHHHHCRHHHHHHHHHQSLCETALPVLPWKMLVKALDQVETALGGGEEGENDENDHDDN